MTALGAILSTADVPTSGIIYTATPANFDLTAGSPVTCYTQAIAGMIAGEQYIAKGFATLFNNSTAARIYTVTMDWDSLFGIIITTGSMTNSATKELPINFESMLSIRSTSLAYSMSRVETSAAAGFDSATGGTIAAATELHVNRWATTASNATGSTTFTVIVDSNGTSGGSNDQTFRLHNLTITRCTP